MNLTYFLGKTLAAFYFHTFYNIKVTGSGELPEKGSFIVCSNHINLLDPVVIAVCFNRKVHFMAKESLFKNKFIAFVIRKLGAFPVDRASVGLSTFKEAMKLLKSGKVMGIFSQGTRMSSVDEESAKAGVSLFAVKSESKVVPVGIKSSFKLFSDVSVNIGEPMAFSEYNKKITKEQLEDITKEIMIKIKDLSN
jgi:1-acyl-sn-glycerol-3-phosphate acyltransferase